MRLLAALVVALGGVAGPVVVVDPGEQAVVELEADIGGWRWSTLVDAPTGASLVDGSVDVPASDELGHQDVTALAVGQAGRPEVYRRSLAVVNPDQPMTIVAMGDSVASGHGLDLLDYLGRDPCWRDEDGAYPALVGRDLDYEVHLVACSSAEVGDLDEELVTGGPELDGVNRRTQLGWAQQVNPELVTLTIGANDLRFDHPDELLVDGRLDEAEVQERLDGIAAALARLLEELVDTTTSTVVVTTYHNPTADNPQGVDGCELECFAAAAADVADRLNGVISRAAAAHPERVVLADVAGDFDRHGAPNGRGPDGLRAGKGFLGRILPIPTTGVSAYCARGDHTNDTWINALDCVHPNGEGARAYADVVLDLFS